MGGDHLQKPRDILQSWTEPCWIPGKVQEQDGLSPPGARKRLFKASGVVLACLIKEWEGPESYTVPKPEDQSVIAAEPCESESMDDVGYIEGKLDIKEQGFGFVEDVYVPNNLVRQDMNGREVSGIKVLSLDKSKGTHSWKALTIDVLPLP